MFADLRLALRALRRAPGSALAAVLRLAFGVGATTAAMAVAGGGRRRGGRPRGRRAARELAPRSARRARGPRGRVADVLRAE